MDYKPTVLTKVIQYTFLSKRQLMGLTQLGLSLQSQITRQFISQVESGKRSPSIFTMCALASACNMTLTELFKEIDGLYQEYNKENYKITLPPIKQVAAMNNYDTYILNILRKRVK